MDSDNEPLSRYAKWDEVAHIHPFRASIGRKAYYDVGRPPPDLVEAWKRCRGSRVLLAFRLAELRDYFVAGHAHQGAQVEPDHAVNAARLRTNPVAPEEPADFGSALALLETSIVEEARVDAEILRVFNRDIERLLAEGRVQDAIDLAQAMPTYGAQYAMALSAIRDARTSLATRPFRLTVPLSSLYTAERAAVMTDWIRAFDERQNAERFLLNIAVPMAKRILEEEGRDALVAFRNRLPGACEAWIAISSLFYRNGGQCSTLGA